MRLFDNSLFFYASFTYDRKRAILTLTQLNVLRKGEENMIREEGEDGEAVSETTSKWRERNSNMFASAWQWSYLILFASAFLEILNLQGRLASNKLLHYLISLRIINLKVLCILNQFPRPEDKLFNKIRLDIWFMFGLNCGSVIYLNTTYVPRFTWVTNVVNTALFLYNSNL